MAMEKRHYFTPSEKSVLLKILKKYETIIDDKGTNGEASRRKNIAWNRIACEYNTSSTAPYPANSKQLRRLWFNLKQRNKLSLSNLDPMKEFPTEESTKSEVTNFEEESNESNLINVGAASTEKQLDLLNMEFPEGNTHGSEAFTTTDSEGRAIDVEFIDEVAGVNPSDQSPGQKELNRVKNNIIMREYQDRRRRQNELHMLQKRLLMEQIRESRAKASLAELELRQQQYLQS